MDEKEVASQEIVLPEDIESGKQSLSKDGKPSNTMFSDVVTSFKNLLQSVLDKHYKGQLPFQLLAVVVIYNFVLFQSEEGKEIYVFIPLAAAVICYTFKYWEFPRNFKYNLSGGALFVGLFWDLIVSISFIPTYKDWGWSYDSAPTLALDLIALFSAIVWFTNEKKVVTTYHSIDENPVAGD